MHSHKARRIVQTIDNFLPYTYTQEIIDECKKKHKKEINDQYVRDVKGLRRKDIAVFDIILEFARKNEKIQKRWVKSAS